LILIGVKQPREIIVGLMPWMAVGIAVILVFLILYGFVAGDLTDALMGADVFVGVSQPGLVSREMVALMNDGAILFALSNPVPEIMPDEALAAGARVVATGRSDFANQVNNVLAFPGMFKGALQARIRRFTPAMRIAAAHALADLVETPGVESIMPSVFDSRVVDVVAQAVIDAR